MQSIYLTYTHFDYGLLIYTPKKLPRSKEWRRNQKYKKEINYNIELLMFEEKRC